MFDYIPEGQINFSDYFQKPKIDVKHKSLVDFINGMGTAQYTQIGNVVRDTVKNCNCDISDEAIERITNNVSVWLLRIGGDYEKYLKDLLSNS